MNNLISMSELSEKLRTFDLAHIGYSDAQYWEIAKDINGNELRALLLDDFKFRETHGRNVVATIYGEQGLGKSLFFSATGIILGKIFKFPFTANDVYFSVIDLDFALGDSKRCQTFLKDEEKKSTHGEMSNLFNENISDYEEQLRITKNNLLYASVSDKKHASFFKFQAWNTNFDPKTNMPVSTTAILYTPLAHFPERFVPRGFITLPAPDKEFLEAYDQRKKQYTQKNLKEKQSDNAFWQIKPYANIVITKRENDLIRTTKEGFVLPQKEDLIKMIVGETIGTTKFTISGYKALYTYLQEEIRKKYADHNIKVNELREKEREQKLNKKLELLETKNKQDEVARIRREQIQKQKLEAEKQRLDIARQKMALKQKEGENDSIHPSSN